MKQNNNEKNAEMLEKIEELTEIAPEEEYKEAVDAEDPEKLEQARKKLMLIINVKCKGIGAAMISGQIKPMVYNMSVEDCENMTEMIKKKGMYGLPLVLKTQVKRSTTRR